MAIAATAENAMDQVEIRTSTPIHKIKLLGSRPSARVQERLFRAYFLLWFCLQAVQLPRTESVGMVAAYATISKDRSVNALCIKPLVEDCEKRKEIKLTNLQF